MYTTYQIRESDLNDNFLQGIKSLFKGKSIEIIIHEKMDETEYLLKSEVNKKNLLESIGNINKGKNIKKFKNINALESAIVNATTRYRK